jgi:hypothetical protein
MHSFRAAPAQLGTVVGATVACAVAGAASSPLPAREAPLAVTPFSEFASRITPRLVSLSRSEQIEVLTRVAGYSIVDFLTLADAIKLPGGAVAQIVSKPEVYAKNSSFLKALASRSLEFTAFASTPRERANLDLLKVSPGEARVGRNFFDPHPNPRCQELLQESNKFYQPLVAQRRVDSAPSARNFEDANVEWLLKKFDRAFNEYHHSQVWQEQVVLACGGADKAATTLTPSQQAALCEPVISLRMLRAIAPRVGLNLDSADSQRLLAESRHHARSLAIVTKIQIEEASRYLQEKLAKSLLSRGIPQGSVRIAAQDGRMVVVSQEGQPSPTNREIAVVGEAVSGQKKFWGFFGGELAFPEKLPSGNYVVVHGDSRSDEFRDVGVPREVAGQLAYTAQLPGGNLVVVHGDSRSDEFPDVGVPREVAGQLAYTARLPGGNLVVVHGDSRSDEFRAVSEQTEVAGQLAYTAILPNGNQIVVHGDSRSDEFRWVGFPTEVAGQLAYQAQPPSGNYVVVHGDARSDEFRAVSEPTEVAGQLAYTAQLPSGYYVVVHGHSRSQEFRWVESPTEVAGQLAYIAALPNGNLVVVHGDSRSDQFRWVSPPKEVAGQLAYIAMLPNRNKVVVHGHARSAQFPMVDFPTEVAGQLAYTARLPGGNCVVVHGDSRSDEFADVTLLDLREGPLLYVARKDADTVLYVNHKVHTVFQNTTGMLGYTVSKDGKHLGLALGTHNSETKYIHLLLPTTSSLTLTAEEQETLAQLNLVTYPNKDSLAAFHEEKERAGDNQKGGSARLISTAREMVAHINGIIAEAPELFLEIFRGKTTPAFAPFCDAVIRAVAPRAYSAQRASLRTRDAITNSSLGGALQRKARPCRAETLNTPLRKCS